MAENTTKFDLLLQNNASRQTFLFSGMEDISSTHLYHTFEDVELDIPEGEYTYVLLRNERDDVEYIFKTPLLESELKIGEETALLRNFQPSTGLLRVGAEVEPINIYNPVTEAENNETIYYYDN